MCTFLTAVLVLLPTLNNVTDGKFPCPAYVRERMTYAIAPGLDLRGGMRLVYTVEVEEAIRDKRDHSPTRCGSRSASFGVHSGRRPAHPRRDDASSTPRSTSPRRRARSSASSSPTRPTGQDRRALQQEVPGRPEPEARPRPRRDHLQDSQRDRDPDPRPRGHAGQGHGEQAHRREGAARGLRHDARRGHHRRGAGRGRASLQRHQGDHPAHGPPRVQDGRRRDRLFRQDQGGHPARGGRRSSKRTRPPVRARASRPTGSAWRRARRRR